MTTWALNQDWDIFLDSNNNIALLQTDTTSQISQDIKNILRLWLGEADFDVSRGINYKLILGEKVLNNVVLQNIINQIKLIQGVQDVLKLDYVINKEGEVIFTTQIKLTTGIIITVDSQ